MAASTSTLPILHPRDVILLRNRGRLSRPAEPGFIRIHKSYLAEAVGLDVDRSEYIDPSNSFSLIPECVVSHATLVYMGFTNPAADILWARWLLHEHRRQPLLDPEDDDPFHVQSFYLFALGAITDDTVFPHPYPCTVYRFANRDSSEEHWRRTLAWYGLRIELIEAILDPEVYHERQASHIMVMGMLHMRYRHLVKVYNFSRERATDGSGRCQDRVRTG